jgi:peroxiredoxin
MSTPSVIEPGTKSNRTVRIGLSLLVALVIVLSAWWIAGRQGLDDLGRGGMNANLLPSVGEVAPDFTVVDLSGQPRSLSDFAGQPVWINFWGSWCPPCRAEMPDLQMAYVELQRQGVVMLAVSLDETAAEAARFANLNRLTFTILSDPTRSGTSANYPIFSFPTHIFVNPDGVIEAIALKPLNVETALEYGAMILNN